MGIDNVTAAVAYIRFEPSFADNVKQDKSIDVYGRAEEEFSSEVDKLSNA